MANSARRGFLGRCGINVIDSQLISRALGILVTEAAVAAKNGATAREIVRLMRGLIPRTYFAFYTEKLDALRCSGTPLASLANPLGGRQSKPLLMLEDGEITPVQRFRNQGSPIERLCEFATEFPHLKHLSILHTGLMREVSTFKAQLADLLPKQTIEEHIYGPVLGTYIGTQSLGVVAFEG